jgi:signal transduction histidine kinase
MERRVNPDIKKERILVVDDEEPVREMVYKFVNHIGHETITARNGREALEILREKPFTILITDIKMPEMDGFELMKSVRAEFPDIHIICMTAHGVSYTYTDVVAFGATDYITKPFTIEEMKAKLNRVILEKNLIRDLTKKSLELDRANEELKRLEQLKSSFISGISHELRTPLTVIKEVFSLVLEERIGTLSKDQKEYLGIANKNVLRLTSMIDTLYDFSRIETGKELKLNFGPVNLIPIVEEAWMTLSQQLEEKKITFENHLDPDTPMVLVDRYRLLEAFVNLIGNGMKSTPPGGKITIDSKGLTEKRDYLKVVVTDTGECISPEELPKVFDRFYQMQRIREETKMTSGLGLAITKEIIEGHQGFIQVESKSGGGTSFIFTLPLFGIDTIFTLLLNPMLEKAETDKIPFSVIQIEFWDQRTKRESVLSEGVMEGVVYAIKMMVRSIDIGIPFQNNRVYIFAFVDKKLAKEIGERVQIKLTQGGYIPKGTNVQFRTYSYPKEARSQDEFLKGCRLLFKED